MNKCKECWLKKFCIVDKAANFYDEMWKIHKESLPQEFTDTDEINEHVKRKSKNRKNSDKSDYPPRCYYAVLLYHMIQDKGLDHYTGLKIDWKNAGDGGKKHDAPAIDHIAPDCKDPFQENGVPNVAFCRNDVNDAKNDLPIEEFIELCKAVYLHNRVASKK